MKKQGKFFIIICCMFATGILLSIIGVVMGGTLSEASITEDNFSTKRIDKIMDNTTEIQSLCLNLSASDVVLKEGSEFSIKGNGITRCEIKNGTWYVTSHPKKRFRLLSIFPLYSNSRKVTITLPTARTFKKISIDAKAVDCNIDRLNCEELDASVAAGSVKIGTLQSNLADISISAGDIKIQTYQIRGEADISCHMGDIKMGSKSTRENNLCNNLDISCNMGDIKYYGKLTGENDVAVTMGDMTLMLVGTANHYHFNSDVVMGDINNDDTDTSRQPEVLYGTGDLSCTMGNISISYQ